MKKQITLRIDEDVVTWFKSQGKGYQSAMNDALRGHMNYEGGKSALNDIDLTKCDTDHSDPRLVDVPCSCQKKPKKVIKTVADIPDQFFKPMPKQGKKAKK